MIEEPVTKSITLSFKGWTEILFPRWLSKRRAVGALEAEEEFTWRRLEKKEKNYCLHVSKMINKTGLSGLHYRNSPFFRLPQVYVNLNIQQLDQQEGLTTTKFDKLGADVRIADKTLKVEDVIKQTFHGENSHDVLLIDGDAGSGKTTLAAYLFHLCLRKDGAKKLGFDKPLLPIYFPLRDYNPKQSLCENLEAWFTAKNGDVQPGQFMSWLNNDRKCVLLILDGLDEISDFTIRQKTCDIIQDLPHTCNTILTTRRSALSREEAGNRERLSLDFRYRHARISDLDEEQKKTFLENWFIAMNLDKPCDEKKTRKWKVQQRLAGVKMAHNLLDYLRNKANRNINNIAGVPMILQIMAMVWEMRNEVPDNQSELYKAALEYLLEFNDKKSKKAPVPLSAVNGYKVLQPVCLWIQDEIGKDEVARAEFEPMLEKQILKLRKDDVNAEKYCKFLVDRAWILAELGKNYIFRHKSFREYFAGNELANKYANYIDKLVENFNAPWWEQTLRFFFHNTDSEGFKAFIIAFFNSPRSRELNQSDRNYLEDLMHEASMVDVQAFREVLANKNLTNQQQIYAIDCLKALGSNEALAIVQSSVKKTLKDNARKHALELLEKAQSKQMATEIIIGIQTFRNPIEDNAEYILISGGEFTTGKTKEQVSVPDRYFAKYPVTNMQYRKFIQYLALEERELNKTLSVGIFENVLQEQAQSIDGFTDYLNKRKGELHKLFISEEDSNRDFNGDEQPVVGVSWFDAKAYCLWLSAFEHIQQHGTLENLPFIYDLPYEYAWEWAAGGREPDGSMRTYPWPKEKGEPNEKLANYDGKVGKTTPVGRYPEGAIPEGLHDMAGNVWEWQENLYGEGAAWENSRVLRGGAWYVQPQVLQCAFRLNDQPDYRLDNTGFRCTRTC